jgi:hypothetical protein
MAWLQGNDIYEFASQKIKWDTDGKGWLFCYCNAIGVTANYTYAIKFGPRGWEASTIWAGSDTQAIHYIGVAKSTLATGDYGWFQIAGLCSDVALATGTSTVGHAIKEASATCVTSGATPSGLDNEFGVYQSTVTTATYNILLFPVMIDGQD